MTTTGQPEIRTYSHWRRRESVKVLGLGALGTGIVVFGGLGSTLLLLVSLKAGALAGLVTLLVIGGVTRRDLHMVGDSASVGASLAEGAEPSDGTGES